MNLEKLIKRYEHCLQRSHEREVELEKKKENLSKHGQWRLGYFAGRSMLYKDMIDDLKEISD